MRPLCAICGKRPASTQTDWDDRMVDACARCVAPVEDPPETYSPDDGRSVARCALRVVMHHDGISSVGVCDALGYLDSDMRSAVSAALYRASWSGALRVHEIAGVRFYFPGERRTCARCRARFLPSTKAQRHCGLTCAKRTQADEKRRAA